MDAQANLVLVSVGEFKRVYRRGDAAFLCARGSDVGLVLQFFVVAINSAGQSAITRSAPTAAVVAASVDVLNIGLHIAANSLPLAA